MLVDGRKRGAQLLLLYDSAVRRRSTTSCTRTHTLAHMCACVCVYLRAEPRGTYTQYHCRCRCDDDDDAAHNERTSTAAQRQRFVRRPSTPTCEQHHAHTRSHARTRSQYTVCVLLLCTGVICARALNERTTEATTPTHSTQPRVDVGVHERTHERANERTSDCVCDVYGTFASQRWR